MSYVRSVLAAAVAGLVFLSAPTLAQSPKIDPVHLNSDGIPVNVATEFLGTVYPEIVQIDINSASDWQPGDPIREIPRQHWDDPAMVELRAGTPVNKPQPDPLVALQQQFDQLVGPRGGGFTTPLQNFEGIPGTTLPPDPTGDVGDNHVVVAVNASGGTRVRVYNKVTGAQAADFNLASTLTGPSPCNTGLGDPIVIYDGLADRWVVTEFSPAAGRGLCVYVSTTGDPTNTAVGAWHRYAFVMPAFPDYPKYGVWPDAYYVTANESGTAGSRPVYAFERGQMLSGLPARFVRLTTPSLAGFGFQQLQPAQHVGTDLPPATAPGIFMRHRDDEAHNAGSNNPTQDFLQLWQLAMNWGPNPPVGTLTGPVDIAVAEFNSRMNGLTAFEAFPQPGGQRLDPLREPIMNVLMYRNFGSHESLVGNLVTNTLVDPAVRGAIRWFELRRTGSTAANAWTLYQEGTYAPTDAGGNIDRWMGGIGVDSSGNIALGYSVVRDDAPGINPGLRYVGRLAGDPLGVMTTGEATIVNGTRTQSNLRWGDYHQMGIDSVDGCTFWFVGEYMGPVGSTNNTRVASFRHDACGSPSFTLGTSVGEANVCAATPPVNVPPITVNVGSVNGFTNPVALSFNPAPPTGVTGGFTPTSVNPPGSSTLNLTVGGTVTPGNNTVTVQGVSGPITRTRDVILRVATITPPAVTLTAPANNAINISTTPTLSWQAANQAASYVAEVATDNAFTNIVFTGNVSSGTSVAVTPALNSSTTYFWRVRAANTCGTGGNSPVFQFRTQAAPGDCDPPSTPFTVYTENFTGGASGYTTTGSSGASTWTLTAAGQPGSTSGGNKFYANGIATVSDQRLISPSISLPNGLSPLTLKYQNWRLIEQNGVAGCYDAGIIEASVNGGAFTQVPAAQILGDPYRGPISSGFMNPLAGLNGWCNDPARPWADTLVDLTPWAGSNVQLRWRLGTDSSVAREGWYVDDVRVQGCLSGPSANLGVTLSDLPDPVENGGKLVFVARASNAGPDPATSVVVDVTLPPPFVAESANGTGWTCTRGTGVSCSRPNLAVGNAPPITILTAVSATALSGVYETDVLVSSALPDPVTGNNAETEETTVNGLLPDNLFANGFECATGLPGCSTGVTVTQNFDDITTLPGSGWVLQNNSQPLGGTSWFQGNDTVFPAQTGAPTAYIGANFNNTTGAGTISNWLVTPLLTFNNASSVSFWTRAPTGSTFPDRLEVRLCTGTPCTSVGTLATDVGGFTAAPLTINPGLTAGGYPEVWTQFTVANAQGLPTSGQGRVAFRYFVTDGGPQGANSDYIGIDTVVINAASVNSTFEPSEGPWGPRELTGRR